MFKNWSRPRGFVDPGPGNVLQKSSSQSSDPPQGGHWPVQQLAARKSSQVQHALGIVNEPSGLGFLGAASFNVFSIPLHPPPSYFPRLLRLRHPI
ncbi:F-box/WD repeat-containing protein 7 [Pyricularia oryzae]|uniref:Uncharacterized protein n=1 Tax=Pyricularia oryzae TaxID=318829 RepID=A0A4P7NHI4_PYROR|nr:F-box/WD repeat-containing protein 7 [Pyricularia oryzae]KAI7924226.1 F-box/WD repeat-containing protein 7 [Pyricularia oryzae]QBZ61445.1 hypothetical protein PoMZ_08394 [Pyricularia oryzae]